MTRPSPTAAQALSFYKSALCAARFIDAQGQSSESGGGRVLDKDADTAWDEYGSDLPSVIRCDLVLRNFAMSYPAAFAPGPVFGLAGWHKDDPWGTGFVRPDARELEGLFATREVPPDGVDVLHRVRNCWGIALGALDIGVQDRLSATTNLVVTGRSAIAAVALLCVQPALVARRFSARTQVVLATDDPASRQLMGVSCALLREPGVPLLTDGASLSVLSPGDWAAHEKLRLGISQARFFVFSADAPDAPDAMRNELERARALAAALGADETIEVARNNNEAFQ